MTPNNLSRGVVVLLHQIKTFQGFFIMEGCSNEYNRGDCESVMNGPSAKAQGPKQSYCDNNTKQMTNNFQAQVFDPRFTSNLHWGYMLQVQRASQRVSCNFFDAG